MIRVTPYDMGSIFTGQILRLCDAKNRELEEKQAVLKNYSGQTGSNAKSILSYALINQMLRSEKVGWVLVIYKDTEVNLHDCMVTR